jgi:ABC-type multidrug transport system fused ATPase/permease subunit
LTARGWLARSLQTTAVYLPVLLFYSLQDSQSERVVQSALDKILKSSAGSAGAPGVARTSVNIAHKLAAVADADCIFVLDRGAIVEQGTHGSLMGKKDGLYRSLAVAQGLSATVGGGVGAASVAKSSSPAK